MAYIETVLESSQLTIKHDGKNVKVPPHVLQMAKDHAFNVIGVLGDLSKKKNPAKTSAHQEKQFKDAFEGYLEGYYESMYPAENPKNRARAAVSEFDLLGENSKFFTSANFPGLDSNQLKQKQNAFKSGVFNLNDAFIEGVLGKIRQKDMPYTSGMKRPETKQQKIHRYYQLMSVVWILSFSEKMFSLNKNEIERYINSLLDGKTEGELNDKDFAKSFVLSIKKKINSELTKVDLISTIK